MRSAGSGTCCGTHAIREPGPPFVSAALSARNSQPAYSDASAGAAGANRFDGRVVVAALEAVRAARRRSPMVSAPLPPHHSRVRIGRSAPSRGAGFGVREGLIKQSLQPPHSDAPSGILELLARACGAFRYPYLKEPNSVSAWSETRWSSKETQPSTAGGEEVGVVVDLPAGQVGRFGAGVGQLPQSAV